MPDQADHKPALRRKLGSERFRRGRQCVHSDSTRDRFAWYIFIAIKKQYKSEMHSAFSFFPPYQFPESLEGSCGPWLISVVMNTRTIARLVGLHIFFLRTTEISFEWQVYFCAQILYVVEMHVLIKEELCLAAPKKGNPTSWTAGHKWEWGRGGWGWGWWWRWWWWWFWWDRVWWRWRRARICSRRVRWPRV